MARNFTINMGTTVTAATRDGAYRQGTIVGWGIRHGRGVVDYRNQDGTFWCYLDQIVECA